jgi:hypothetical protein
VSNRTLYWIVGGIFAILLVVMLAAFDYDRSNSEAEAKAEQLIAAYEDAGLPTPLGVDEIAALLGTDGGLVCSGAESDLASALVKLNLFVGGAFYQRPVEVDRKTLEGGLIIVGVYCPDKLEDYRNFLDDFDFDDVIRD